MILLKVVKISEKDADKWFELATAVKHDFMGLNLSEDKYYREAMIKNMKRGTALGVKTEISGCMKIVGGMTFSHSSKHISWLAVHPDYRKQGIGSLLMKAMLTEMVDADEISVKTFLCEDEYGTAARNFYRKHGFTEGDIIMKEERFPHPVQVFTRKRIL